MTNDLTNSFNHTNRNNKRQLLELLQKKLSTRFTCNPNPHFASKYSDWFIWFICLMAYQMLWVISYQSHTYRRTVKVLFNPNLGERLQFSCLSLRISSKLNEIEGSESEFAYYNGTVLNISHDSTQTTPKKNWFMPLLEYVYVYVNLINVVYLTQVVKQSLFKFECVMKSNIVIYPCISSQ